MKLVSGKLQIVTMLGCLLLASCGQKTTEEFLQSAQSYQNKGNLPAAIIDLKSAITSDPQAGQLRFLLGELYYQTGDLPSAGKEFSKALEFGISPNQVIPMMAKTFYHMENFESVLSLYDEHQLDNDAALSTLSLFAIMASYRDIDDTSNLSLTSLAAGLSATDTLFAQAYSQYHAGQYTSAMETLANVDENSRAVIYHSLAGSIAMALGNNISAIAYFEKSKKLLPITNSHQFQLVETYIRANQYEQAEQGVQVLLKHSPNSPLANLLKAKVAFALEDFPVALQHADVAIQSGADTVSARIVATGSSYRLDKIEQTYSHLLTLEQRNAMTEPLLRLMAHLQLQLGYSEKAKETLLKLSSKDIENAEFMASSGMQLAMQGDLVTAQKMLAQAAALDANDVQTTFSQALVSIAANDPAGISNLEKVLEQDPSIKRGWVLLAMTHLGNGDQAAALEVAREWQKTEPAKGLTLEGNIYFRSDEKSKAEELLLQALQIEPDNLGAMVILTKLYQSQNKHELVFQHTQDALKLYPTRPDLLMALVQSGVDGKHHDEAADYLKDLFAAHAESNEVLVAYAVSLRLQGKVPEAIELLQNNNARLNNLGWLTLGDALFSARELDKAIIAYKGWRKAIPNNPGGWLRSIGAHDVAGEKDTALSLSLEASKIFTTDLRFDLLSLTYLIDTNKLQQASTILDKLKTTAPNAPRLSELEAQFLFKSAKFEQASELYGRLYAEKPVFYYFNALTTSLNSEGRYRAAEKLVDDYLAKGSEDVNELFFCADAYAKMGRLDKAEDLYNKLLSKNQNNIVWVNNLANVLLMQQKYAPAKDYANKALSLLAQAPMFKPYVLDTLGWSQFKLGEPKAAFDNLYNAHQALPENNEVTLHLLEVSASLQMQKVVEDILKDFKPKNASDSAELKRIRGLL